MTELTECEIQTLEGVANTLRALALAIARRESEFDPAARSRADARGLISEVEAITDRLNDDDEDEPDPDSLREDRDERRRMAEEDRHD